MKTVEELSTELEALCDVHGTIVIDALVHMCLEKAVHVRQYADSDNISRAWVRAAKALNAVHFPY